MRKEIEKINSGLSVTEVKKQLEQEKAQYLELLDKKMYILDVLHLATTLEEFSSQRYVNKYKNSTIDIACYSITPNQHTIGYEFGKGSKVNEDNILNMDKVYLDRAFMPLHRTLSTRLNEQFILKEGNQYALQPGIYQEIIQDFLSAELKSIYQYSKLELETEAKETTKIKKNKL